MHPDKFHKEYVCESQIPHSHSGITVAKTLYPTKSNFL